MSPNVSSTGSNNESLYLISNYSSYSNTNDCHKCGMLQEEMTSLKNVILDLKLYTEINFEKFHSKLQSIMS